MKKLVLCFNIFVFVLINSILLKNDLYLCLKFIVLIQCRNISYIIAKPLNQYRSNEGGKSSRRTFRKTFDLRIELPTYFI